MSTTLLTQDIWPQLTKIARGTRQPCAVAVAYFGAGASQLLPLPKNSRLVVDASERAIASGQTCPADLIKLVKRGVRAYSVPNLHAKVFVLGRAAYIGSANASNRSASHLVEAVVRTTETDTVRSARQFVRELCLHELTPAVLKHLAKLYRPPHVPGGQPRKLNNKEVSIRPALPRLLLGQLRLVDWSEREQAFHDTALAVAKRRREHPRNFELDSFMKISTILDHIDSGHMALPEFQRGYVWNRDQVRGLFDSLYAASSGRRAAGLGDRIQDRRASRRRPLAGRGEAAARWPAAHDLALRRGARQAAEVLRRQRAGLHRSALPSGERDLRLLPAGEDAGRSALDRRHRADAEGHGRAGEFVTRLTAAAELAPKVGDYVAGSAVCSA
jgi:hypothetical protein